MKELSSTTKVASTEEFLKIYKEKYASKPYIYALYTSDLDVIIDGII